MQVYVELALLENFCMDFTLLCGAKAATKNGATYLKVAAGGVVGACAAALIPLVPVGRVGAVALKLLSGLVICLVAGKFSRFKSYFKFTAAFFVLTALAGGALIAVFSLSGLGYEEGIGYILSSVPIGIPLFFVTVMVIAVKRLSQKFAARSKARVKCRIFAGERQVEIAGFYDSGNRVFYRGAPVSVIPEEKFLNLALPRIKEAVKIHTVAGSRDMPVFTADRVEIDDGKRVKTYYGLKIGVSPQKIDCAVLHPDLLEE